jgi:glycosyltransferase involved in cell wall biosynthesis
MANKDPFVSVIVPVYNGEATIVQCVESLLAQDYPSDRREIIIVDNGSKDHTVGLIQSYAQSGKIILLNETQVLNAYGARNTGARVAKGEILAFTDADCKADANWLLELVKGFRDSSVGCLTGKVIPAPPQTVYEKYWDQDFLSQKDHKSVRVRKVLGANCAYLRQTFGQIGFFRQDIPSGSDTEFAYRMQEYCNLRIQTNLDAVVRHRNVSSLQALLKQYMRYGTATILREQMQQELVRPSFVRTLITTVLFTSSFIKRVMLLFLKQIPPAVKPEDTDIFLWRPCLRILTDWAVYIGFKLATSRPELLR